MKLSVIIISILLFGALMTGFGGLYNNFQITYSFNGIDLGGYDQYETLNSSAAEMGGSVKTGDTIVSEIVYIDGIVRTLKSLTDLPSTINTIIIDVGNDLGLPSWLVNNLTTIIILLIGFSIATIIWRFSM